MITIQFLHESAAKELAKKLPSLEKYDYDTIDKLMRGIAKKHHITGKALHDIFVRTYRKSPDAWIKGKLDESDQTDYNNDPLMTKFIKWTASKLNLDSIPEIEFSYDTEKAQQGHHTGVHVPGEDKVWVYVNHRNMVDIMRTVFHELAHVRQGELGMIKPGDSYPGSPIETQADELAGKFMKIFGKSHPEIFQ
jgi:hypothetical protein